jgi:hypothetical protein
LAPGCSAQKEKEVLQKAQKRQALQKLPGRLKQQCSGQPSWWRGQQFGTRPIHKAAHAGISPSHFSKKNDTLHKKEG